jgi:hypothetical protein
MVSLLPLASNGRATFTALNETKIWQGFTTWLVRVSASRYNVLHFVKQSFAHDGLVYTFMSFPAEFKETDVEWISEEPGKHASRKWFFAVARKPQICRKLLQCIERVAAC